MAFAEPQEQGHQYGHPFCPIGVQIIGAPLGEYTRMGYMYKSSEWVAFFLNVELCQLYAHAEHMHVVFLAYGLHEDMYIHMTVCVGREKARMQPATASTIPLCVL